MGIILNLEISRVIYYYFENCSVTTCGRRQKAQHFPKEQGGSKHYYTAENPLEDVHVMRQDRAINIWKRNKSHRIN